MLPNTPESQQIIEKEIKSNRVRQFFPFAYALTDQALSTHCSYCLNSPTEIVEEETSNELAGGKKEPKLSRCGGCKRAYFCNAACQKRGWTDHSLECACIKRTKHVPASTIRLLVRALHRHKQIENGQDKKIVDFYKERTHKRPLLDLMTHEEDLRKDQKAMDFFDRCYSDLLKWNGGNEILSKELTFQIHCILLINSIKISDHSYTTDIADGVFPDLASYDHSCRPNAYYYCNKGFTMTMRSVDEKTSIDDHQQTFIAYIKMTETREERQRLLKKTWYFDCNCVRCNDPQDELLTAIACEKCGQAVMDSEPPTDCPDCKIANSIDHINKCRASMHELKHLLAQGEPKDYTGAQQLIERFRSHLPNVNLYMTLLKRAAVKLCSSTSLEERFQLHESTIPCMRLCFANNWQLAYHLYMAGTQALKLKHNEKAIEYLQEAINLLEKTVGSEHPKCKSARKYFVMAVNQMAIG